MRKQISSFLLLVFGLAACTSHKEEKKQEEKYTVTSPFLTDTSFVKEYVAQIQSLQNVEIRAQVEGYLQTIHVDEGQLVQAGQLLFTIMPNEYQAELLKAKAEARTAELEMQNIKTLAEKNIVSNSEYAMAEAKFDQAKAAVSLAELHLSFTQIKAPFTGVIDRIRNKPGSLIEKGALLTTLSNNKEVYAYFNVSEVEYLTFKAQAINNEKNSVSLLLANNELHKYKGKIETIEGEFDNNTGNIAFRAKFPNPEMVLRHGETGKVQLKMEINKALIIPQKATFDIQDKLYVYVVDKNNQVKSRNITIKEKMPNLYIVESGISPNETILLEGIQTVKEDSKIETEYLSPVKVLKSLDLIKQ